MTAPHDSWATALAFDAVSTWRTQEVAFVRRASSTYDPATGAVTTPEQRIACGAAIPKLRRIEEGGTAEQHECEAWFDSTTLPLMPTTADVVEFMDKTWRIVAVDPAYTSGTKHYAYKLLLRT